MQSVCGETSFGERTPAQKGSFPDIASPIKPCQKMPLKIKFIKDDDEGILPYCEEEDAEKFYFQQILTARFSWGSNNIDVRE